jgi:phage terminase large subunit-like protein
MAPGEALVAMTLFLTIGGAVVLRGPIGKALAERLAGRRLAVPEPDHEQAEQLDRALADLEDMKHRVAELEERQDFTERVLAAHREPNRLER